MLEKVCSKHTKFVKNTEFVPIVFCCKLTEIQIHVFSHATWITNTLFQLFFHWPGHIKKLDTGESIYGQGIYGFCLFCSTLKKDFLSKIEGDLNQIHF